MLVRIEIMRALYPEDPRRRPSRTGHSIEKKSEHSTA